MTDGRTPAVHLTAVSKVYPAARPVRALVDIDLMAHAGDTLAITGPSGAGKSTLLSVLGTLERPSAGTVRIAGADTSRMSDRCLSELRAWRVGFVFQRFFLLEYLSVLENVAAALLYRGVGRRQRRELAARALRRVGLAPLAGHRPGQLSGGERQRVAVARAVVGRPALLLADEPTGNLDSATGAAIAALLAGLADDRTAVVVITHNADVAAAMARRVRLRDGRIVAGEAS